MNTGFTAIAAGTSSTGAVTITGTGSVWNLSDTADVAVGLSQGLTVGQTGAGTLTLAQGGTLNVLSTGSTVLLGGAGGSSGTLNIGAAWASPAVAPGTLNASTVTFATGVTSTVNFNHTSSNYVFSPQLTGTGAGSVNIIAGTTIFTADNTYQASTIATNVSAGATAQFGNGGTTGSLTDSITNNGTVAFNRSNSVTYAGVISSGGSLEQRGTGTLILTGANTYTGGTTITSGTLQIGGTTVIGHDRLGHRKHPQQQHVGVPPLQWAHLCRHRVRIRLPHPARHRQPDAERRQHLWGRYEHCERHLDAQRRQ